MGLKINKGKRKVIRISSKNKDPIILKGQEIEGIVKCVYLGATIDLFDKHKTLSVTWSIVWKLNIHRAFTFNMVHYCTAFDCSNNGTTEGISFHSFPKVEKQIKVSCLVFILGVLKEIFKIKLNKK